MRSSRFVAVALTGTLAIAAISCSGDSTSTNTAAPTNAPTDAGTPSGVGVTGATGVTAGLTAAGLRSQLTVLLNEHVILAADATDAALAGRTDEFNAAVAEVDRNSEALAGLIGVAYGDSAGQAFLPLWRKHIGFFVDYTTALGSGDQAAADKAVGDLTAYAGEFAAFLNSANPDLSKATLTDLVTQHILTLKSIVDAQATGDEEAAYTALGNAVNHMHMIADPLAAAISEQFPDRFPGDSTSDGASLQVTLNSTMVQHVAYAATATNAALGGRAAEFDAAAALLDVNSQAIAMAVGSVYGEGAGQAFLPLWRKHIGFFVDYTKALATQDEAAADAAVADLTAYAGELAVFFNSANPDLSKDTVSGLVAEHIVTLKSVVDAQAAGNQPEAYQSLGTAMGHMHMLADPLAAAIAQQFPERYPAF
jgi:hypothetical protein